MVQSLVDNGVVTRFAKPLKLESWSKAQTSTGLGGGIAMPHSKNEAVKKQLSCLQNQTGVDYILSVTFSDAPRSEGANDTHGTISLNCLGNMMKPGFCGQASWKQALLISGRSLWCRRASCEEAKRISQRSSFILTNRSSLLLQHVQLIVAHLHGGRSPHQKVKKWVLQSVLKPTGHQVSATAWQLKKSQAEGSSLSADKAIETARFDGKKSDL